MTSQSYGNNKKEMKWQNIRLTHFITRLHVSDIPAAHSLLTRASCPYLHAERRFSQSFANLQPSSWIQPPIPSFQKFLQLLKYLSAPVRS